jgi:serine protease AprX
MDPLTIALDRLWDQGVTVVVASGNDGANSLTSPANDPQLLVVGAQDERDTAARSDDVVPDFSAYGTAFGSSRPDVVAPGVSLVSSSSKGSLAYTENPSSIVKDGFMKGTGTSMSAAVAAGAIATLLAARPTLSPDDAKRLIMGTAERTPALRPARGAGQGGLDLGSALTTPLNSVPELNNGPRWASKYGPAEEDGDAWSAFATAWVEGDLVAVAAAWSQMSPQTRKWAANAWSLAALIAALRTDDATWDGRKWAGRKWASEHWAGRKWAEDAWVGRKWADSDWLASVWDGRKWAGRKWANSDWLAFAWRARMVAEDAELGALYAADTDDWSGRKWASIVWVGRKWAADAWAGRKWADYAWDGRKWAAGEWSGRKWADFAFEGRKWANGTWDGRKWALVSW